MATLSGLQSGSNITNQDFTEFKLTKFKEIKHLVGSTNSNSTVTFSEDSNPTVGYQVPTGKVFIALYAKVNYTSLTPTGISGIGPSTNDAGNNSTGIVLSGFHYHVTWGVNGFLTGSGTTSFKFIAAFKAGYYVSGAIASSTGSTRVSLYGFEVNETDALLDQGGGLIKVGSHTFYNLEPANLVTLGALIGSGAGNSSMYEAGAAVGYQVPAGKRLLILDIIKNDVSATLTSDLFLGYGDNDIGFAAGSPPTNNVDLDYPHPEGITGNARTEISLCVSLPAGKYPYFRQGMSSGAIYLQAIGLLVDA